MHVTIVGEGICGLSLALHLQARGIGCRVYESAPEIKPLGVKVVRTDREQPPDFINIKVEELVDGQPFDDLDKYITQDELRAPSENYKRVAGFALTDVRSG